VARKTAVRKQGPNVPLEIYGGGFLQKNNRSQTKDKSAKNHLLILGRRTELIAELIKLYL
jgi:hypothetical protein